MTNLIDHGPEPFVAHIEEATLASTNYFIRSTRHHNIHMESFKEQADAEES